MTQIPEILRPAKAAELLGVSVPTINRMVRAGLLKRIKVGARASGIIGVREHINRQLQEAQS